MKFIFFLLLCSQAIAKVDFYAYQEDVEDHFNPDTGKLPIGKIKLISEEH
jgi:hypothetical protein